MIFIRLSTTVAIVLLADGTVNSAVFKSATILLIDVTSIKVLEYPNLAIAPAVTSSISKIALVDLILILPDVTSADTPGILSACICVTILEEVGDDVALYVFEGNPISLNAEPLKVNVGSAVDITNLSPDIVADIYDNASMSCAKVFNLDASIALLVDIPKSDTNGEPVILISESVVLNTK